MGKHVQTGSPEAEIIKPIAAVSALTLSAGTNISTTPVLSIINEISGPLTIFSFFPNGVFQATGSLPRLATGTNLGTPSNGDGAPDGSIVVDTTNNLFYYKSGGSYTKVLVGGGAKTFATVSLTASTNQLVLQSAGVTGTLTWTPTTTGKTITFPDATGTVITTANLSSITSVGTIASGTWQGTVVAPVFGGTGLTAYTLGDVSYASAANTLAALSGNVTTTNKILMQTGTGSVSAAPSWGTLAQTDLPGFSLNPTLMQARLTYSTGVPVPTSDVTGAAAQTLYLTKYTGDRISLWLATNNQWIVRQLTSDASLALTGLAINTNYDIYIYWTGSAVAIDTPVVWSSNTTPPTRDTQNGVLVKNLDPTRKFVGVIRTTSNASPIQGEDSTAKRYLWNMFNRIIRLDAQTDASATWTTAGNGTWAAIHSGNAAWKKEIVIGVAGDYLKGTLYLAGDTGYNFAVALDSSTAILNTTTTIGGGSSSFATAVANYSIISPVGYHYLQGVETSINVATANAYGQQTPGGGTQGVASAFKTEGFF